MYKNIKIATRKLVKNRRLENYLKIISNAKIHAFDLSHMYTAFMYYICFYT